MQHSIFFTRYAFFYTIRVMELRQIKYFDTVAEEQTSVMQRCDCIFHSRESVFFKRERFGLSLTTEGYEKWERSHSPAISGAFKPLQQRLITKNQIILG